MPNNAPRTERWKELWKSHCEEYGRNPHGDIPSDCMWSFIEKVESSTLRRAAGVADERDFKMDVDSYLKLVKDWNPKNFDDAFDKGYKQAKSDISHDIRKLAKKE